MTTSILLYFETNQLNVDIDLPAVITQINKDISQSGGTFVIGMNLNLVDAFDILCAKIQEWLLNNEVDMQALLYRIDVSEADIRKEILSPQRITELVFKREIIKVKFRKQFSSK